MSGIRLWISIGVPVLSLAGVCLGAVGALTICRPYFPFSEWQLPRHMLGVAWYYVTGKGDLARRVMSTTVSFGELNPEDRTASFTGVYFIFLGFILQAVGCAFWGLDALLSYCCNAK